VCGAIDGIEPVDGLALGGDAEALPGAVREEGDSDEG
jgi:hypothetical protein